MKSSNNLKSLLLALPALLSVESGLAQFRGSIIDLGAIYNPPQPPDLILCSQFKQDTTNLYKYTACVEGVNASRQTAEKYAQKAGYFLGCVDGTAQGLHQGFQAGRNPTDSDLKEAEAYLREAKFTSALERAKKLATEDSRGASADELVDRYRAVLNSKDGAGRAVLPNKAIKYPDIVFGGFTDGYDVDVRDKGGSSKYNRAIELKWITPNSPYDDQFFAIKSVDGYSNVPLCNQDGTFFGRNRLYAPSWWDYWQARGVYNFEQYGWNNADWAWDILEYQDSNLDAYMKYKSGYSGLKKTILVDEPITEKRVKKDANGNIVQEPGPDGVMRDVYVDVVVGTRQVQKTVNLSAAEVAELQSIFRDYFKLSYGRYYAQQYASIGYNRTGMERMQISYELGKSLGREYAVESARRNAYDQAYRRTSVAAYSEVFRQLYEESFKSLLALFENNPILELQHYSLFEENPSDGAYTAGEGIGANIKVANLGERAGSSTFGVASNSALSSLGVFSFIPTALATTSYQTPILGRLSMAAMARQSVDVTGVLSAPGALNQIQSKLNRTGNRGVTVRSPVEIVSVKPQLDPLTGAFSVEVMIENPLKTQSLLADVEVEFDFKSPMLNKASVLPMSGSTRELKRIQMSSVNAIELIRRRSIPGEVRVRLGDRIVDERPTKIELMTDPRVLISQYFDFLARGSVANIDESDRLNRLQELKSMIEAEIDESIRARTLWKRPSQFSETILPRLQEVYLSSKGSGWMAPDAQGQYDQLAQSLARKVLTIKTNWFLNRGRHRRAYLRALAVLSSKVKTRVRDYR